MVETGPSMLGSWSAFFSLTGGAAAILTGLMFVVVTLMRRERSAEAEAGISTFSSPTVVHFGAALIVSAVILAPWQDPIPLAFCIFVCGVVGFVHSARVIWRGRRMTVYTLDAEDWAFYSVLPMLAYCALILGACLLAVANAGSLFACGGAVIALIFIGIRNAWDVVTYLAMGLSQQPPQT